MQAQKQLLHTSSHAVGVRGLHVQRHALEHRQDCRDSNASGDHELARVGVDFVSRHVVAVVGALDLGVHGAVEVSAHCGVCEALQICRNRSG